MTSPPVVEYHNSAASPRRRRRNDSTNPHPRGRYIQSGKESALPSRCPLHVQFPQDTCGIVLNILPDRRCIIVEGSSWGEVACLCSEPEPRQHRLNQLHLDNVDCSPNVLDLHRFPCLLRQHSRLPQDSFGG